MTISGLKVAAVSHVVYEDHHHGSQIPGLLTLRTLHGTKQRTLVP